MLRVTDCLTSVIVLSLGCTMREANQTLYSDLCFVSIFTLLMMLTHANLLNLCIRLFVRDRQIILRGGCLRRRRTLVMAFLFDMCGTNPLLSSGYPAWTSKSSFISIYVACRKFLWTLFYDLLPVLPLWMPRRLLLSKYLFLSISAFAIDVVILADERYIYFKDQLSLM